jgi:outer membrane protein TolC
MYNKILFLLALFLIMWTLEQSEVYGRSRKRIRPMRITLSDSAGFIANNKKYSLQEMIQLYLEKNLDIQSLKYDRAMTDTDFLVFQKQYSPYLNLEGGVRYQEYPEAMAYSAGEDTKVVDASASVSKRFSSGTTFSTGIENEYTRTTYPTMPSYSSYGDPEYHRPVLFASLTQELLKNSFGYSERKRENILKNNDTIQKQLLQYQISTKILELIIDYWTMGVYYSSLDNARLKLQETRNVRNIIRENVRLGLAERYQLNLYNSLVANSEATTAQTEQNFKTQVKKILRNLDMDPGTEIKGVSILIDAEPEIDRSAALHTAYAKRADYRNAQLALENAQMALAVYENDALPEVTAELKVSSMGQEDTFPDASSDASSMTYPAYEARLKMTYPLDDTEQEANVRNARYQLKQSELALKRIRREVRDDIITKIEEIHTAFTTYQKSKQARIQSERYYLRLHASLKRGRFTAATVRDALDGLADSRQREIEALVDYNVALLRFDLARNELLEKYNINLDAYVKRVKKMKEDDKKK